MSNDSIAVTGLSCRFPGQGQDLDSFWQSICEGQSAWREVPRDRFRAEAFWSPPSDRLRSTSAATGAHFLEQDISRFDAAFFGLPKHDADAIDPQQRILLEVAYEALERAGLPLERLAGTRTGVYMGHLTSDYRDMICRDPDNAPLYTFTGTGTASLANRMSWLWDLHGPSFPINTACSSSLLALHLACQSLRTGESDIALVGGCSLLMEPETFSFLSNQGFLSPDGKCKAFDASADGYGRGEGIGCVVLKRADDALSAGDPIRAVVRGTGSNQDGRTKGLTMPNADAQRALINEVYQQAGLNLHDTAYVEAHGTGTRAGDSNEMQALANTIAASRSPTNPLIVGSVKTNIGHLEAAAGIAGIIKAVLMLETGMIPPNLHFKNPNPEIQFEKWNVQVPTELTRWPTEGLRRISINSFGYGGTNAHAVLEDARNYINTARNDFFEANEPKHSNETSHVKSSNHVNGTSHVNGTIDFNGTVEANGTREINGTKGLKASNGTDGTSKIDGTSELSGTNGINGLHAVDGVQRPVNGVANDNVVGGGDLSRTNGTLNGEHLSSTKSQSLRSPRLYLMSAQDKDGLARTKLQLAQYLKRKVFRDHETNGAAHDADAFQAQLAYTLSERRSRLQWKTFALASSKDQLVECLAANPDEIPSQVARSSRSPRIGFVFTGQGAQWPRMGAELMTYQTFRQSVEAADKYLQEECGSPWSAVDELLKDKSTSLMNQAGYSHALSTILQVALVDLLRTWNILPTAVVGHSGGEIGASYASGALTKEDTWKTAFYRGCVAVAVKVKAPSLRGSMIAVGLSHTDAWRWISRVTDGQLVVACINSPTNTTVAGDADGIDQLLPLLTAEGIFARKLVVDTAYHSPHLEVIADDYRALASGIKPIAKPQNGCLMYSTVTGSAIQPGDIDVEHWVASLTSPVRYSEAVYEMVRPVKYGKPASENAVDVLVEVGPHPALKGPTTQSLKAHGITHIPHHSVVTRNHNAIQTALSVAGALFTEGCPIRAPEVNADSHIRFSSPLTDLPTYSWNHSQRFWHDSRIEHEYATRSAPKPGLLGSSLPALVTGERMWKGFLRTSEAEWIADHRIQGSILYPAAGYITMALEAALQTVDTLRSVAAFRLRDIQLTAAAVMDNGAELEYIIRLRPHVSSTRGPASTWTEFSIHTSGDRKTLVQNCCGLLMIDYEPGESTDVRQETLLEHEARRSRYLEARNLCKHSLDPTAFYAEMHSWGLEYGSSFTNMVEACNRDCQSVGFVKIPSQSQIAPRQAQLIHPATLDAVFHLAFAATKGSSYDPSTAMVPKWIDAVTISARIPTQVGTELPGFSDVRKHGLNELNADITMLDDQDLSPVAVVEGLLCTEVGGSAMTATKSLTSKPTWKPALGLMTSEELRCTMSGPTAQSQLAQYITLLHHSRPALKVIQVVSQTSSQIPACTNSPPLLQQEHFASIASTWNVITACRNGMLAKTESVSDASTEIIDFPQESPTDGIEERFDLLIAYDSGIGSEGPDPIATVRRMCRLLKRDGLLCALVREEHSRTLSSQLESCGMEIDILMHNQDGTSLLACKKLESATEKSSVNGTANGPSQANNGEVVLLQANSPSEMSRSFASQLVSHLEKLGHNTSVIEWSSGLASVAGKSCISLLEVEKPMLSQLTYEDFESLRSVLLHTKDLLWVTSVDDPAGAMIDGLARVVRNETPGLNLRILHVDAPSALIGNLEHVTDKTATLFSSTSDDNEFRLKEGTLQICRFIEDTPLNEEINSLLPGTSKAISSHRLEDAPYPVKLGIGTPGMLSSVRFEPDETAETELEADHVEIITKATALNFREVMFAMGQMNDTALGLDAAGVVRRVGSAVSKFQPGDRIIMYGYGAHRSHHRSPASFCTHMPDEMSFEQASSIPAVHATAWNALIRVAKVEKGQSILIHAAAGGVGQVALQIAQHYGMEVFATVSSKTKRDLIREEYGVFDDHIFNSRDLSFAKGIKRITKGRGVDVVLNSLAGEALRETWHCIAPFGHFVEIGIKDILNNTGLDMRPFLQDATFTFFNLRHVEENRPELMATIFEGAFDFVRRGITRPVEPLISYPISEVEDALRLMQTGKHLGKVALTWGEEHIIPVINRGIRPPTLSSSGSYLLVGGLGGLGRSLATKLVRLGARKICFLSRSGAVFANAKSLVRVLEQQHVQVLVCKCNVAEEQEVAAAVKKCRDELGDVRGVFQCAMVLRDGLFATMSHQDWVESTRPKVQGSWNLHKQLPKGLDFFITLSSFTGVYGSRGQSNYSSAGTYQDALAYYRRALGEHAVTIDLGLMRDIGVLAEAGMTDAFRDWEVPYGIREAEFLALIERCIDHDVAASIHPQVVTGLATGGSALQAGISMPYYLDDPRFAILAATGVGDSGSAGTGGDNKPVHALINKASSLEEASLAVLEALVRQVAKMLQAEPSEVDTTRFLHSFGIDSLVAIEIVNWAKKEAQSAVTVFDVLSSVPMTTLSTTIAARSTDLAKELVSA